MLAGWLADSVQEYADALIEVLTLHRSAPTKLVEIAGAARRSVTRFSDEEFSSAFRAAVARVL